MKKVLVFHNLSSKYISAPNIFTRVNSQPHFREKRPIPEGNGNPALTFSTGMSKMRCFALWERWEFQLFPENYSENPGLNTPYPSPTKGYAFFYD